MPPRKQPAEVGPDPASGILKRKEHELEQLQAEVDRLRRAAGQPEQIALSFHVLEYSRNRLEQSQVPGVAKLIGKREGDYDVFKRPEEIEALLDELQKRDLVKILSQPTVITVNRRQASFRSGGEVPTVKPASKGEVAIGYARFGTEIEVLPALVGRDTVQVDLRLGISKIDGSVPFGDGELPRLRSFWLETGVKMRLGEFWILTGPTEKRYESQLGSDGKLVEGTNEIETLIAVKPSRLEPKQAERLDTRARASKR
jgi:hypothetical protein